MTTEQVKEKLLTLHVKEDSMNKEMSVCDKQIRQLILKKTRLAKKISRNMKFRNLLINKL